METKEEFLNKKYSSQELGLLIQKWSESGHIREDLDVLRKMFMAENLEKSYLFLINFITEESETSELIFHIISKRLEIITSFDFEKEFAQFNHFYNANFKIFSGVFSNISTEIQKEEFAKLYSLNFK